MLRLLRVEVRPIFIEDTDGHLGAEVAFDRATHVTPVDWPDFAQSQAFGELVAEVGAQYALSEPPPAS